MTYINLDTRQTISLEDLALLTDGSPNVELRNILRSADSDIVPLLRLSTDEALTISVASASKSNPETDRQSILAPINNMISNFTSGSVVLPAIAGGVVVVTPGDNQVLTLSPNNYIKMGIHLDNVGNILVNFGTESATISGTGAPLDLPNSMPIGYVLIGADGGSNIQNIAKTSVFQYMNTSESVSATSFQDRNTKMIAGGTWLWNGTELSLSDIAYIQVPGLDDTSNKIAAQSIALAANEVAYVSVNRSSNTPTTLTVLTANINAVPQTNDTVIVARRDGSDVLVGTSSFRLKIDERLELDGNLAELNRKIDQLKILPDLSNAAQVKINGADIDQLDGTTSGQELADVFMDFSGATINFNTGNISGTVNGVHFTPFAVPIGEYFWYGIGLVEGDVGADNRIKADVRITPATSSSAVQANAKMPLIIGAKKLGAVQVFNNGTSIEVVNIRRLSVGSDTGDEDVVARSPIPPAAGFAMAFTDGFDLPITSTDTLVDSGLTNATHNLSKQLYELSCDANPDFTGTGTNITLSTAPNFTVQEGDIIYIASLHEWRRITVVNTQQDFDIDVAFSADPSADAGMVSQAVWTKDLVNNTGDASENTRPRDFYPNWEIKRVQVDYQDSLILEDDTPDFIDDARIVVAVSQEGLQADVGTPSSDNFSLIYTRPNAPDQIIDYLLADPGDKQRLFVVFFCNPANAAVTGNGSANLIKYKISFYDDEVVSIGGTLDSAFCVSDGSGTEINCDAPYTNSGVTHLLLDWSYVPSVNPGETQGDLTVIVDGKEIPRFVAGSTNSQYYEEVPGNNRLIKFHADISAPAVEIQVYRRQGTADTADQNTIELNNLQSTLVVTSATTLDKKRYQKIAADSLGGFFTINLPSSPDPGDTVLIQDPTASWSTFNVTVGRNGNLIEGVAADDILSVDRAWAEYEYYNAIQGWIVRR